jgi:hypothetical protein
VSDYVIPPPEPKEIDEKLSRWALATELHGQHSVLWTTGRLAQPKAILLDPRVLRRSITTALRPPAQTAQTKGTS